MNTNDKYSYKNIPDTPVYDGNAARQGFHLNQFCMSLMKEENRKIFLKDEAAYLEDWPLSDEQKQAVIKRDITRLVELGGNIYFLVKIAATDGISVLSAVSTMTTETEEEYAQMMRDGGRSPVGNRFVDERKD